MLIFVTGAIPARDSRGGGEGSFDRARDREHSSQFRERLGNVTVAKTVPMLRQFVEAGGTILSVGTSTSFGTHAGLPLASALVEKLGDGSERPLPRRSSTFRGSILQMRVDNTNPLAYGMGDRLDVFWDNSPVFRLKPEAALKNIKPVAWFDSDSPLRSGWAWGQKYLRDGVSVVDASLGKGKVFMFAPEITFRAQPHGSFKFLFNGIYYGGAESVTLR